MTNENHDHLGHAVHVSPISTLLGVWALLMALTIITVAVVHVDLGRWNIPVALGVAAIKATIVALYFMHLRYDKPFNCLLFVGSILLLMLFIGLTLMDTRLYQPDIKNRERPSTSRAS